MYKTISANLVKRRVHLRYRSDRSSVLYGVMVRLVHGKQKIRVLQKDGTPMVIFLDRFTSAKGACPGDTVRLHFSKKLGLYFGEKDIVKRQRPSNKVIKQYKLIKRI